MASTNNNKHKPKRIEKELLLLRNLPKEYKLGKRETSLGTLLYVHIINLHALCIISLLLMIINPCVKNSWR